MSTQTEVHIIVDVDIEEELPCESVIYGCNNEAEWAVVRPCKHRILICNSCLMKDNATRAKFGSKNWHCVVCNFEYSGNDLKFIKI